MYLINLISKVSTALRVFSAEIPSAPASSWRGARSLSYLIKVTVSLMNVSHTEKIPVDRRGSGQANRNYDFIVCGAGSSGSVVAARLAENHQVRVLLIEAGGSDLVPEVMHSLAMGSQPGIRARLGLHRTAQSSLEWPDHSFQHGQSSWWRLRHQRDGLGERAQERLGTPRCRIRRSGLGLSSRSSAFTVVSRTGRAHATRCVGEKVDPCMWNRPSTRDPAPSPWSRRCNHWACRFSIRPTVK